MAQDSIQFENWDSLLKPKLRRPRWPGDSCKIPEWIAIGLTGLSLAHSQGKQMAANKSRRQIWLGAGILLILFAAAAAWKWTPLADQIDIHKITAWVFSLRNNPARPLIILGGYLVGSLLLVPITILILATALVFGPLLGVAYSFAGCFLGGVVTYGVGYFLGRDFVRQITGTRWKRIEQKISQAGIMAVATTRLVPVAPFTVVNVISGAFQVPPRDYVIGSLLGLAPGIIVINLFAHQFERAIRNPGVGSYMLSIALVALSLAGTLWLRRKLANHRKEEMVSV
jgi:phospholipase D1/2